MDWIGDPTGSGVAAAIGLLVLFLLAMAWGQALKQRQTRLDEGEFQASEPDHERSHRTTFERLRRRSRRRDRRDRDR